MTSIYNLQPITNSAPEHIVENMRTWFDDIAFRLDELNRTKFTMLNHVRYEIATGLYFISENKLWAVSDYSSVRDFANKILGLKSVAVSMYIKVAKFLLCKDKPLNIFGNDDFTITQLYKMSQIALDDLRDYVNRRLIIPEMTAREIDAFVAEWKFKQQRKVNLDAINELYSAYKYNRSALDSYIGSNDTDRIKKIIDAIDSCVYNIVNEAKNVTEMNYGY